MNLLMKTFSLVFVMSGLTGCAMTMEHTQLNYKPPVDLENVTQTKHMAALAIGKIDDARGESDPLLIVHKENAYGPASGGYEAEKEITTIIENGISDALEAQGYPLTSDKAHYVLSGELLSYDQTYVMGMWDCKINGKMELKLKLRNRANDNIIWQDMLVGRGTFVNKAFYNDKIVSTVFNKTLDDIIRKLNKSSDFQRALLK